MFHAVIAQVSRVKIEAGFLQPLRRRVIETLPKLIKYVSGATYVDKKIRKAVPNIYTQIWKISVIHLYLKCG